MKEYLIPAGWLFLAYIVGAIPFGFIIGKLRGVDVRTVGSKNIGATNVFRTVGKKWGLLAFFCDFLKGLLPTLAVIHWGPATDTGTAFRAAIGTGADFTWLPVAVGVMCVVGHMFTCFMKFKGGKGIATGFGMMVALVPWHALAAIILFAVVLAISHYVSLGSIIAAAFLGITVWFPVDKFAHLGYHDLPLCILITVVAAFAVWKHRANIGRLVKGCENKIF